MNHHESLWRIKSHEETTSKIPSSKTNTKNLANWTEGPFASGHRKGKKLKTNPNHNDLANNWGYHLFYQLLLG
jgi:hypothetical protein